MPAKKVTTTTVTKDVPEEKVKKPAVAKKQVTVAPTPVAPPVVKEPENKVEEKNTSDLIFSEILEKMVALSTHIKSMQVSMKVLIKEFDKQKKIIDKVQKKRDKAKKSPSGFAKPCKISNELCDFIGVEHGCELSRTDITRKINEYVKEKNLNNPENRREFFPDKKLKSILNVKEGEKVTYFILQRLIAHHFPPSAAKLAAAAAAKNVTAAAA
jgi:chromatin remodeling complex protein RSC6